MPGVVISVFDSETGATTEHPFATSPVRIGRNPLNDLPLPFPFVSGWHAVLRFDDTSARFFDLGSTNGTLLNGRKIEAGEPVEVGEMLSVTIGKLELRFRRDAASAYAGAPSAGGYPAQAPYGSPPPGYPMAPAAPAQPAPIMAGPTAAPPMIPPGQPPSFAPMAVTGAPPPALARPPMPPMPAMPSTHGDAGTAAVQMADVHQAIQKLRPRYDAYRQAWAGMQAEIHNAMGAMHGVLHEFAISMFAREFPEIADEREFKAMAARAGARIGDKAPSAPTTSPSYGGGGGGGDLGAVQTLSRNLRPGDPEPMNGQDAARFMACVEDVLRASAKAFVELQKGQEQFGNEMGVRTIKEFTPLHAAGTADNVLKYLLDWQKGGPHRTQELVGVYADLMIHQVALINGVMEGVRSMLARLEPAEIERSVSGWAGKSAAAWKSFVQRYEELTESDRTITSHVFGPEFARAYAEVGGEGAGR